MFISSAALVRYVLLFRHVLACLFLQSNLPGMYCFWHMFWHVYFFTRTCQACCASRTCVFCFGQLLDWMTRLQLFVYALMTLLFTTHCLQRLLHSDFTCCVFTFVLPGRTDATLKQFERHKLEKKESGTWSLEWLHCKLLVSSFNLKCQYMSVYAMVGITRSKVILILFFFPFPFPFAADWHRPTNMQQIDNCFPR